MLEVRRVAEEVANRAKVGEGVALQLSLDGDHLHEVRKDGLASLATEDEVNLLDDPSNQGGGLLEALLRWGAVLAEDAVALFDDDVEEVLEGPEPIVTRVGGERVELASRREEDAHARDPVGTLLNLLGIDLLQDLVPLA